jgi:hypothetical protein
MEGIEVFSVGEPFPDERYKKVTDGCLARWNTSFFDALGFLPDLHPAEIKAWRNGTLQYGVFVEDHIPFFLIDFGNNFSFDMSFNLMKVADEEARLAWLDHSDANGINMILTEKKDFTIKAMRLIGIKLTVAQLIRNVLSVQINHYKSHEEVEAKIIQLTNKYSIRQMILKAQMHNL